MRIARRAADAFLQDFTYAVRALARAPGITAAIVVTFALGIGANAAVFATLDRVFFRPPSGIIDAGSLRRLYAHQISSSATEYGPKGRVTPFLSTRDMLDLASAASGVARVEGYYLSRQERTMPDERPVRMTFVSPGYLDMLGVRIQRGRAFAGDEARLPGPAAPVTIISDAFWRARFESDPDVVGKTVQVGQVIYTVIGVAGVEFEGIEFERVDLWAPLTNVAGGEITWLRLVMRVAPDVDLATLDQRLSTQYRHTHQGDRAVEDGSEIISAPLLAARGPALSGTTVLRIPGMSERTIAVLSRLGIIGGVVLVIAIANVASLLLMRAIRRRHEIGVRRALGVSSARFVGQLVTESVILSTLAGVGAVAAAALTGGLLRTQLAPGIRWTPQVVDDRLVMLTMGAAILGGCLAGVAPSLFALRLDIARSLKTSSWGGRAGTALRSGLLITQAALCMALLASAGVVLQSLRRAQTTDRGFDSDRTLLMSVPASYAGAEADLARMSSKLRTMPDVESVGRSLTGITATGFRSKVGLSVSDTIGALPQGPWIDFVDAEWGRAVGVRLVGGRMLDSSSRTAPVAVINEALARALYRGRNVAGTCIRVREPNAPCREVIGVVRDIHWDPSTPATYRVYVPIVQAWTRPPAALVPNYLVIRTRDMATTADVARIRAAVAPLTSTADRLTLQRVTDMLEPQIRPWRLATTLFLMLGGLGLLAAGAGIYGLVAYDVAQRTREIGLRIALGAPQANVLRLVVGSGLRVLAIGGGIGILAALLAGKVMSSVLYATAPYDLAVLFGTAAVLCVVMVVASLFPAWRATRVSPVAALSAD